MEVTYRSKDLTDKVFGKLTAKSIIRQDSSKHNIWFCECDCGNTCEVRSSFLINELKTSCGDCKKFTENEEEEIVEDNGEDYDYEDEDGIYDYEEDEDNEEEVTFNYEEIVGNIFDAPCYFHIAHCINTHGDFNVGLSKEIENLFCVSEILRFEYDYLEKGNALLIKNVFNLITKENRYDKVAYKDLEMALFYMKEKMEDDNIRYLAIPKLGCGKDGLEWNRVKEIIFDIFEDFEGTIRVYSLD
jgi:hypothetical protein